MSDTQQRIVTAALELFLTKGFEGAATADICKKAHVKKGSLYHFFPSKHQLLTAALNDYARPITSKFADIAQSSESIESGVVELFAIPLAANTEWKKKTGRVLGCLVGNMASELGAKDDGVSKALNLIFDQWHAALLPLMQRHFLASEEDACSATRLLVALHQGAILTAKLRNDESIIADMGTKAASLLS
jgi:TetR/AcrR family transcriptional regulator, transcriptional repressor for nem operon